MTAAIGLPDADAATLRDLDAAAIAALPTRQLLNQVPILDRALPASPADTFADGDEARVPYVTGSTEVELPESYYPAVGMDPQTAIDDYAAGHEAEVDAAYDDDEEELTEHFLADLIFTEPARYLAEQHADRAPTYRYRFEIAPDETRQEFGGAIHGSDLPFVFGYSGKTRIDDSADLAEEISGCWASFARTGLPSCGGVDWPETGEGLMEFTDDGPRVSSVDPWQERLDLVERIRRDAATAPR